MLQEIVELSPTTRRLTISVPSDIIKSETAAAYNKINKTTRIPGFRPGKAPQAILIKKFGKNVEAQVIEKVVPEYYTQAIKEAKLEPISYPSVEEKIELVPDKPLSFTVTIEVKPEVANLSYEGINLKKKSFEVKDQDIDKALSSLQESKAIYSVTDDRISEGDMAVINTDAFISEEHLEDLSYKEYPFILNSGAMPEEFTAALKGKKKGDSVKVEVAFEDNHPNKKIAGQKVTFSVTITEAKKKSIPPLDDEFAKNFEAETLEELKTRLRENLIKRRQSQVDLEYKKEILAELTRRHDFDVPSSMVEGEIDSLIHQAEQDAARRGETPPSAEELRKTLQTTARDNVKSVILLEAIGKKETIEVDDTDTKEAINEIALRNDLTPEEVTKLYAVREGSMEALRSRLFADKVLDHVLKKAVISET